MTMKSVDYDVIHMLMDAGFEERQAAAIARAIETGANLERTAQELVTDLELCRFKNDLVNWVMVVAILEVVWVAGVLIVKSG